MVGAIRFLGALKKQKHKPSTEKGLIYVDLWINGQATRALVDTGATDNFIANAATLQFQLNMQEDTGKIKAVNSKATNIMGVEYLVKWDPGMAGTPSEHQTMRRDGDGSRINFYGSRPWFIGLLFGFRTLSCTGPMAFLKAHDLREVVPTGRELASLPPDPTLAQIKYHSDECAKKFKALTFIHQSVSDDIFPRIWVLKQLKRHGTS
ncbi:hypothetical protein GH714_022427 [Hevea brasiliensis]|uniref:Peptidase A2 domain-containing protein n=1 Tax=Hevea brasiliensis TaxID=3981 RepID=A0A6A6LZN8_HEVBR|nr:hypothetical protein GH714_022427 [Hevea brasiliensis]